MIRNHLRFLILALAGAAFSSTETGADLVLLRNGRSLPVSAHRVEGDRIVLIMEGGGVISLNADLVAEVRPAPAPPPAPAGPPPPAVPGGTGAHPGPAPEGAEGPISLRPGEVFDPAALRDLAARMARRHRVSEALVQAVIEVESRYDAFAVSPRGAMGLMQLMPATAARFAVTNAFDPVQNVEAGVRYLKELLERYDGQLRLALAAYNAGEEAVDRFGGIPPYRETRHYVVQIFRILGR
jgi:soluble lytic murein transglycosylase-like protein